MISYLVVFEVISYHFSILEEMKYEKLYEITKNFRKPKESLEIPLKFQKPPRNFRSFVKELFIKITEIKMCTF